ncbi:MAG TPA: FliM/FliN family flagellar motor switch protein [Candidatus Sulfotelmatobacter sp.]|nr:FliM/FliN family flagellar motor switch protein [Candidatus Sulfotelmatobacter sp.]
MQKILNQEEIDAMVRAARGGAHVSDGHQAQPHVEPWDVRRAGQIGREQLQTITALHESFARNLTHSLGAYLRVVFAVTLVSAEHLTFREFMQRIPETTYLASCRLDPTGLNGALQLDLKVAFPIIDLLLGGEGKSMSATREITDIEEQILDSVARIICREVGSAWQALALEVTFEERLEAREAQRLMSPDEKTLSLSFEVTMPDVRGGLTLAIPAAVSNALLRKMAADWSKRRPRAADHHRQTLMRLLLDCPFDLELGAATLTIPINKLVGLHPGHVIAFSRPVTEPASLLIGGTEVFQAFPARRDNSRAARVLSKLQRPTMPEKEKTK